MSAVKFPNQVEGSLSAEETARFWEDGFLVYDDVLTADELAELRAACDDYPNLMAGVRKNIQTETVHLLGLTRMHPAFMKLAYNANIVSKIVSLIGRNIQLQHSKLATKPPTKGTGVYPWHQDYAFFPHTNTDLAAVMVMLDDATPENGCMQMVKGSHRLGLLNHMNEQGRFTGGCVETTYWESEESRTYIQPKAGGISIHHCLTLHGSDANFSGKARRGIVFQYRADDAYQLADTVFEDTGLLICGERTEHVRCDAGVIRLPRRSNPSSPFGAAWNQAGAAVLPSV
jgi:phytanoyl-CoA hydroxylase